ncbi:cation:proton antiporter regulatory subunit [Chlamydiota bacterium]
MNLLLFVLMLIISFLAVRVGAIAFQLTGLEWSLSKFQALSCFSGTGFTTKESELITGNPQRRKIASLLMVLGNVGLVTLIATFANSLRPIVLIPTFKIPFLPVNFPSFLIPWIRLCIISVSVYVIYRIFTHSKFTKKITFFLRDKIVKKEIMKPVSFEELLVTTGGYGVSNIEIIEQSPIIDKKIVDADLRGKDITILAIERKGEVIPNPRSQEQILLGDRIICFGKLSEIKQVLVNRK